MCRWYEALACIVVCVLVIYDGSQGLAIDASIVWEARQMAANDVKVVPSRSNARLALNANLL